LATTAACGQVSAFLTAVGDVSACYQVQHRFNPVAWFLLNGVRNVSQ